MGDEGKAVGMPKPRRLCCPWSIAMKTQRVVPVMVALADCGPSLRGRIAMARNLREVVAAVQAERRARIAAAYRQRLIAKKKKRQLEETKRVMELDRNLIVIVVLIITLPIIAALAAMLTVLAVSEH